MLPKYYKCVFFLSHKWWAPPIHGGIYHLCKRGKYAFIVLPEYLIIFHRIITLVQTSQSRRRWNTIKAATQYPDGYISTRRSLAPPLRLH